MKKTVLTILVAAFCFLCCYTPAFAYSGVASWFAEDLQVADEQWGILPDSLRQADLSQPVSRLEFCQILLLTYNALNEKDYQAQSTNYFSDCNDPAVAAAYELGLVAGYDDGTFQPDKPTTRQEMFKMMYNLLLVNQQDQGFSQLEAMDILSVYEDSPAENHWSLVPTATLVSLGIAQGVDDNTLGSSIQTSRLQAVAVAYRYLESPLNGESGQIAGSAQENIPTEFIPEPEQENGSVSEDDEEGTSGMGSDSSDLDRDALDRVGYNEDKYILIFGSLENEKYATAEEAASHMKEITVPVWALRDDGTKYSTEKSLLVHEAIAQRVEAVFAEIYGGDEQFPIKNVGGYAWRGNGTSEHNWGLAIDINYEENYQVYPNGTVAAGKYWLPGEDPYSIPEDGDVVNAFNKYGFAWGGNAWRSNNDYMHFSYFGN